MPYKKPEDKRRWEPWPSNDRMFGQGEGSLRFLFKIEHSFTVTGRRGVFLVPGLPVSDPEMPRVRVNDKIQLRLPDATVVDTFIAGIEHAKTAHGSVYPIKLPAEIKEEKVPPGTEVWLI